MIASHRQGFQKGMMGMKTSKEKIVCHPAFAAVIAVICTLLWGTAFPCIKLGYEWFHIESGEVPSQLLFAGARFFIAGLIVMVIGLIRNPKKMLLHKKDILPISLLGFFQTFLQYLLLYTGIVHVSGTKSAIFTSLSAFGSVLLSAVFFKSDKLTLWKIAGCVIGVIGIIVMNLGSDGFGGFLLLGDGLVILSNLSGAAGNVISKKISPDRDPYQISSWQLMIGGAALIVIGLVSGGRLHFYDLRCVLMLLYLALMAGVAFMLWTMLLFHHPVSRIAVYNLLIPVFGTMWSALFLGENVFTLNNILALLFVCSGIFLVNSQLSFSKRSGHDRKS